MKAITISISNEILGMVVPSGIIPYEIFRREVGKTWTEYFTVNKNLDLIRFTEFHNARSHVQIERLLTEVITLD